MKKNYTILIFGLILPVVLIALFFNWLFLTPLSFNFISTLFLALLIIAVVTVTLGFVKNKAFYFFIPVIILGLIIVRAVFTSGIFRAGDYKSLVGTMKEEKFSNKVSPIDIEQLPIVDESYASQLAEKKLGEDGAIGSQAKLGTPTKQVVNNKLCWVVPLLHNGFFSWMSNSSGTPGYIVVSAIDADDVKFVKEYNGKPIKIKYQPNAFFSEDLTRHIYYNGNMTNGITDFSFEIDNSGKPYWVASRYKNTIGFSGQKIIGTAVVDAQTGEVTNYGIDNTPKWVDRIQPGNLIRKQINWYGKYIQGFQWFTNNNKIKVTDDDEIIYNNNECYFYNGLTSVGKDNATLGFTLTNSRTHETTFYRISGATESSSKKSMNGKVQNMGYKAGSPILINIQNIPTYFAALKDSGGVVRMYGMVSAENYNLVGVGNTPKEALSDYTDAISNSSDTSSLNSSGKVINEQATVLRIGQLTTSKSTFYYIVTKEKPNIIYVAGLSLSDKLPVTQPGDKIEINYINSESNTTINLKGFKNLQF